MPRFLLIGLLFPFISCSKYFAPTQQVYQQHEINNTIAPDSTIINYYQPYKQQLESEMNRVIGYAAVSLTKPGASPETLLGNFFADALLAEGQALHPNLDFSFGTKGGLRIELQKGNITVGNIFELMPFDNQLVVLELSSESLLQLAQFIAATGGQPTSGLQLKISDGKASDIRIGGEPIDRSKTYKLLTYDYLANGGDDMKGLDKPIHRIDIPQMVRDALIDHVSKQTQKGKHINTQLDGRITRD